MSEPIAYLFGDKTKPVFQPTGVVTRAFIMCVHCQKPISTMGGPKLGAWCITCTEAKAENRNEHT